MFSYKNQLIDLQCKSVDWFLYEENIGMKKVDVCKQTDFRGLWQLRVWNYFSFAMISK